ncbi:hypothetical protein [Streptomyces roseicoloratus]|uniref:hypothetical protein n=1 Tax=Streptomyces roseicoloratus TaxID=2508722 RepID=UPI001009D458|nr:hypothetical protein [Streptomyces roseicoloratus]
MPDRQSTNDNNPFAPPPEGQPDQPWQPRLPEGSRGSDDGSGAGPGWSSSQPGRSSDGFGGRPERNPGGQGGGQGGSGGSGGGPEGGQGPGLRWDPTDPAQRRARYAVLSGMWAFFFSFFVQEVALLLGALGVYWAISALRTRTRAPEAAEGVDGPPAAAQVMAAATANRAKQTSAISGLVASALALMIVASGFLVHLVYQDFYECRADALTKQSQLACNDLLPKPLQDTLGVRE